MIDGERVTGWIIGAGFGVTYWLLFVAIVAFAEPYGRNVTAISGAVWGSVVTGVTMNLRQKQQRN
jgi:hypothetical protein